MKIFESIANALKPGASPAPPARQDGAFVKSDGEGRVAVSSTPFPGGSSEMPTELISAPATPRPVKRYERCGDYHASNATIAQFKVELNWPQPFLDPQHIAELRQEKSVCDAARIILDKYSHANARLATRTLRNETLARIRGHEFDAVEATENWVQKDYEEDFSEKRSMAKKALHASHARCCEIGNIAVERVAKMCETFFELLETEERLRAEKFAVEFSPSVLLMTAGQAAWKLKTRFTAHASPEQVLEFVGVDTNSKP